MQLLTSPKFKPVYWVGLALLILVVNFNSDPFVDFPMMFLIPVLLASWYSGRWWGLLLAVGMPLARLTFSFVGWQVPWTPLHTFVNASIRITVLSTFAILTDLLQQQQQRIQVLEGLLPICHVCKRIRDEENNWYAIDRYLNEHAGTLFLQGICSDCVHEISAKLSEKTA